MLKNRLVKSLNFSIGKCFASINLSFFPKSARIFADVKGKLGKYLVLMVILAVTAELSPYLLYPVMYNHSFSASSVEKEQEKLLKTAIKGPNSDKGDPGEFLGAHVLHPYLGFVNQAGDPYNTFGFAETSPFEAMENDQYKVAITGGSVAMGLYHYSSEALIEAMKKQNLGEGKEIKLVLLALPGYKQPQQLFTLNYFLSLGAEFDMLINLDGFNEVALPYSEHLKYGIFPFYPRAWNIYAQKGFNKEIQSLFAEQNYLKKRRKELVTTYRNVGAHHSRLGLMVWKIRDANLRGSLYTLEQNMQNAFVDENLPYQVTGPDYQFSDTLSFFKDLAKQWHQSSKLMNEICQANDIDYHHFLQPNQYVIGSKVLSKQEMKEAFMQGEFEYKSAVRKGYGSFIEEGRRMKKNGLPFNDLTFIYKNEKGSVYSDQCCHFNKFGYDIMAREVVRMMTSE